MQNKQAILGIVVAAIIILGAGGVFLLSKNKPSTSPTNTTSASSETKPKNSMASNTLQDLFSGGKSQKCTFDAKTSTGENKGTVYVTSDKAYAAFDLTASGKTTTSYLIRTGDTFYIWGGALPSGIKMTMSLSDMAKKSGQYSSSGFNPTAKADYSCSGWSADQSLFTPPANVKFIDAGSLELPSGTVKNPPGSTSQCNICNSLTGDAKSTCLNSFHCQ